MKRDVNSNGYIFLYSTVLVVIVAVLLTAAALWLQPYQQRNKENEKRMMILSAAGITDGQITLLEETLPIYLVNDSISVIPMEGKGLWGPIWGYFAIAPDGSTIIGANFDHKSETPGLGGEITTDNVFLLSIYEAKTYFANKRARFTGSMWWLRSPGSIPSHAACIYTDGEIVLGGSKVYDDRVGHQNGLGVRPAMWIKLD